MGERPMVLAASPRPWKHDTSGDGDWSSLVIIGEHQGETYGFEATHDGPTASADAALITRAVNEYDALRNLEFWMRNTVEQIEKVTAQGWTPQDALAYALGDLRSAIKRLDDGRPA